jgi:serine/threonine protein kinase
MRTQIKRDPLRFYEVIKIIGEGSIGRVSKVQKRSSALGGSARWDFVSYERRRRCCFGFRLPFFPCPVNAVRETDNSKRVVVFDEATTKENLTASTRQYKFKAKRSTSSMITYGHKKLIFALKTIHMDKVRDPTLQLEMINEIAILQNLDHPNIVKAIETFDYSNQLFLLLELCNGGDLYARDPYTEEQANEIVRSVLDAIGYMHSRGITHRDLKYENIMFASPTSNSVKIIDFGLSKKYAPEQTHMHDTGK